MTKDIITSIDTYSAIMYDHTRQAGYKKQKLYSISQPAFSREEIANSLI